MHNNELNRKLRKNGLKSITSRRLILDTCGNYLKTQQLLIRSKIVCLVSFVIIWVLFTLSNEISALQRWNSKLNIKIPKVNNVNTYNKINSTLRHDPHIDTKTIRSWGCSRNETPFIFVHIGKAGGGEVRRMFAAAAINYFKPPESEKKVGQEEAFYAVQTNVPQDGSTDVTSIVAKGRFGQGHRLFWPSGVLERKKSLNKGNLACDAETPIGQAVQCPADFLSRCPRDDNIDPTSSLASCHLVYAGHNLLGNEMHWLPSAYLSRWWESLVGRGTFGSLRGDSNPLWNDIPNSSRCGEYNQIQNDPVTRKTELCRKHLTQEVDFMVKQNFLSLHDRGENTVGGRKNKNITVLSWSPVYASMPLLRVTVTREPFSWLASKYEWHRLKTLHNLTHDNIREMTRPSNATVSAAAFKNEISGPRYGPGWVNHFALQHIMSFCGEDCVVRYIHETATLGDIVRQAEENLRHSFAVVGLLTETQSFYNMVVARVGYMTNLTRNKHLIQGGGRHQTRKNSEAKTLYKDPDFQRQIIEASPEFAALVRLYEVSVKVNQYQLEELKNCPSWDPIQ